MRLIIRTADVDEFVSFLEAEGYELLKPRKGERVRVQMGKQRDGRDRDPQTITAIKGNKHYCAMKDWLGGPAIRFYQRRIDAARQVQGDVDGCE